MAGMSWERVWGAVDMVAIDGETGVVYAQPVAGPAGPADVYEWNGKPDWWSPLAFPAAPAKKLVTSGWNPQSFLYCLGADDVVYRHGLKPGTWVAIGGPDGGKAGDLFAGVDQLLAVGRGANADVYRWDAASNQWIMIGGPGKTFVVGKSSDSEFRFQVFGLSLDNAPAADKGIYQWTGSGWSKRGGPAGSIIASRSMLFATTPDSGDVMSLTPTGWKHIGGPGRTFAADNDGHLYAVTPDGKAVYAWNGTPNKWHKIGGPAGKLFVGFKRMVLATDPETGWLYRYQGTAVDTVPDFAGTLFTEKMKPVAGDRRLVAALWDPKRPLDPAPSSVGIKDLLFGPRPSARDWFLENSHGKMDLVNVSVHGWNQAPVDKQGEHYWDNPDDTAPDPAQRDPLYHQKKYQDGWLNGHAEKWCDAISRVAQDIDVAAYDSNQDQALSPDELGFLVVIPQKKSYGTWAGTFGRQYPTSEPLVVQKVKVPLACEWYAGDPPHLGTLLHELSHLLLQTPDMYFDGQWPFRAGDYSISDVKNSPIHLSAPEKLKLGWLDYKVAQLSGCYELNDVETTNEALILFSPRALDMES